MLNGLPVYEFLIDDTDETGVKAISIVTEPAFQSSAVFFAKKQAKFIKLADEKKQIVAGLSLIPDVPVYRVDPDTKEEFYGYFSADTIEKIVIKYHEEMNNNKVNLDHNPNDYIDAVLVEDFIVNSDARIQDLTEKGLVDVKLGSWYTAFKIKDKDTFDEIQSSGDNTGFSIEVFLDKVLTDFNKQIKNNIITNKVKTEMKKNNKSLLSKIIEIFKEAQTFERSLVPELAFEIVWEEVGQPVYKVIVDAQGVETQELVGQGEFTTDEGIVVTDDSSNLVEVREPVVVAEPVVSGDTATTGSTATLAVSGDTPTVSGDTPTVTGTTGQTAMRGIDTPISSLVDLTKDGLHAINVMVEGGFITEATHQTNASLLSKQNFGDMEKRLKEFIPTDKAGSYSITVDVDADGNYVWGSVSSWTSLKFHAEPEVQVLNARIVELEAAMKEPITEPVLAPEATAVDFSKMTAYEKLMHKKGLQPVK